MRVRLITEVGTRVSLRRYWGDDCPNCVGSKTRGYHNAQRPLLDVPALEAWDAGGEPRDHPADRWPTQCEGCGAPVPESAARQVFRRRLYDTPSGKPEPGDMYWLRCLLDTRGGCPYWDNCDGRHLHVVLPNGHDWDCDSRCSNCSLRDDRTHRCWIRTGEPPLVTAGKSGHTCSAGAGSIAAPGWHGFLRDGQLVVC
jgi:hypothetical protein